MITNYTHLDATFHASIPLRLFDQIRGQTKQIDGFQHSEFKASNLNIKHWTLDKTIHMLFLNQMSFNINEMGNGVPDFILCLFRFQIFHAQCSMFKSINDLITPGPICILNHV